MSSSILVSTGTSVAGPLAVYSVPITTTITSPPRAYFTSTASNSDWNTDTTTLIDGTIRPVLVGCKVCGGLHHGIIVAGLGGGPVDPTRTGCGSHSIFGSIFGCGTEFEFAPLPPFVIEMDGTPKQEGSSDDESGEDCDNEDLCSFSPSDQRKTQESTTLTLIPTSTSTLLSSSNSKVVSSTSSGLSREYMVFPTAGVSSDDLNTLTRFFADELGTGNVLPVSLGDSDDETMYIVYTNESSALSLPRLNPKVCDYLARNSFVSTNRCVKTTEPPNVGGV